jgi:hypothetical protein
MFHFPWIRRFWLVYANWDLVQFVVDLSFLCVFFCTKEKETARIRPALLASLLAGL